MAKLPVRTSSCPGCALRLASASAVSSAVRSCDCTWAGSVPSRAVLSVICSRSCWTSTVPVVCSCSTFCGGGRTWAGAAKVAAASAHPASIVALLLMVPFFLDESAAQLRLRLHRPRDWRGSLVLRQLPAQFGPLDRAQLPRQGV